MFNCSRIFIVFFCLVKSVLADPTCGPKEKTFLWQISNEQTTIHLLGSIHVFKKAWYPLNSAIEYAFENADHLVVEVDVTALDQTTLIPKMMRLGAMPKGKTLQQYLSEETLNKLQKILGASGFPFNTLNKMQPWFLEVLLSVESAKQLGFSEKEGIDLYFIQRAKKAQKTIVELETVDIQFEALAGSPLDLQVASLEMALKGLEDSKTIFDNLLCAWWMGDKEKMYQVGLHYYDSSPAMDEMVQRMVDQRNIPMVEKIKGFLRTKGRFFVVVGALHFGGEKGLIQLLKNEGIKVKQIPYQRLDESSYDRHLTL